MRKALGPLIVLGLIALGLVWLFTASRDEMRGLDASPIGSRGAALALAEAGIPVTVAGPGPSVKAADMGLRLVPLYDMDLGDDRPETLGDTSQRTMPQWVLWEKTQVLPTLIALPKWRWVTVQKGVAAPETLIPLADYTRLLDQLGLQGVKLRREGPGFVTGRDGRLGSVTLFQAQVFDGASLPSRCLERMGPGGGGALVISCTDTLGARVLFLSDPDLLNNHGLTLGSNAATFAALMRHLQPRPPRPVYLDALATDYLVQDQPERVEYERTSADLARFFASPLGEIWAMLAIVLALFVWRGARRFGPLRQTADETPERSRREALATRARLIRLTGQDGAMVADYVRSDLARMAETAFGPGRGDVARLAPLLARRNASRAAAFQSLAADLMRGTPRPAALLLRQLDTYHALKRSLTHGDDA